MNWQAEALWQVFEAHGVDVATMTPKPLQGPVMVTPETEPPAPEPVAPEVGEAERQEQAQQLEKNRRAGRRWRWS